MGDTVLQPTDRQRVAETLLFHTTSCHLQSIYADYQSFAIEGGCCFFHLKYVFIEYHPIATEGGRYGKNHSIYFCIPDSKTQNTPNFTVSPIPDHH